MPRWREICRYCLSGGVRRRSLLVALVVGAILNLINQGDALLGGSHSDFTKIVLTFAVPYCVATYGAVSYRLQAKPRDDLPAGADLRTRTDSSNRRSPAD